MVIDTHNSKMKYIKSTINPNTSKKKLPHKHQLEASPKKKKKYQKGPG